MRKIGTKLLLSLVLSASVLSISTSVFATEIVSETETVSNNNAISSVQNVSFKDYLFYESGRVKVSTDYKYALIYFDGTDYMWYGNAGDEPVGKPENVNTYNKITDINSYVTNIDNYESLTKNDTGYARILDLDYVNSYLSEYGYSLAVFLSSDSQFYNTGMYSNFDFVKENPIDTTTSLPTMSASIKGSTANKATIEISYKAGNNSKVTDIVCLNSTRDKLKVIDVDNESEGIVTLDVTSNDTYIFNAYTQRYITDDLPHSEISIDVNSIKTSTPEEDAEKDADTTAPKVTFSAFPDSALNNTSTELTMYSDEPAILNFNGVSSNDYVTEMKFSVSENDEYNYQAQDKSGNTTSSTLKVEFFKDNTLDDFDRDSFWDTPITSALPQTGSIGFYTLIDLGLVLVIGGAFFVYKGRKKKSDIVENNETSEEQSDDTNNKTEDSTDELSEQRQVLTETLKKVQEDKE